jgi:hypothetical protein
VKYFRSLGAERPRIGNSLPRYWERILGLSGFAVGDIMVARLEGHGVESVDGSEMVVLGHAVQA